MTAKIKKSRVHLMTAEGHPLCGLYANLTRKDFPVPRGLRLTRLWRDCTCFVCMVTRSVLSGRSTFGQAGVRAKKRRVFFARHGRTVVRLRGVRSLQDAKLWTAYQTSKWTVLPAVMLFSGRSIRARVKEPNP